MSRKIRTRVSLYVFVNENGKPFYHVAHVGFFAPAIAAAIAESIDAAGLAFHRNVAGQTGMVDLEKESTWALFSFLGYCVI